MFAYVKLITGPSSGSKLKIPNTYFKHVFQKADQFDPRKKYLVKLLENSESYYKAIIIFLRETEAEIDKAIATERQRLKSSACLSTAESHSDNDEKQMSKSKSNLDLRNRSITKSFSNVKVKLEKFEAKITQLAKCNVSKNASQCIISATTSETSPKDDKIIDTVHIHDDDIHDDDSDVVTNGTLNKNSSVSESPNKYSEISKKDASQCISTTKSEISPKDDQVIETDIHDDDSDLLTNGTLNKNVSVSESPNKYSKISKKDSAQLKKSSTSAKPSILSNIAVHSENECNMKMKEQEDIIKELKKKVEKGKDTKKEFDKLKKKYNELKIKYDQLNIQVDEYEELNKKLQRSLLETKDEKMNAVEVDHRHNFVAVGIYRSSENTVHIGHGKWLPKAIWDNVMGSKKTSICVSHILLSVFGDKTLMESTITGKSSNASRKTNEDDNDTASDNGPKKLDPTSVKMYQDWFGYWLRNEYPKYNEDFDLLSEYNAFTDYA